MLDGRKIPVTGATGQVTRPIAEALARRNEVWCIARFSDPEARRQLEAQGIRTHVWHMGDAGFGALPDDFTHVIHSAAEICTPSHDESIRANAEGAGFLMAMELLLALHAVVAEIVEMQVSPTSTRPAPRS
jgi:nucleoside-diphosphate-sugar epimerase